MKILFVCTGNTCRSPMAEALYRKAAAKAGRNDEVISRGIEVGFENNKPIGEDWPSSKVMMQYYGLDISQHVPQKVTPDDIAWADLILTMAKHHVGELRQKFGNDSALKLDSKLHAFGNYVGLAGENIEDPHKRPYEVYVQTADRLNMWVRPLVEKLNSHGGLKL